MIALPIAEQRKQQKWKIIVFIAKNNDFSLQTVLSLQDKIVHKTKITLELLLHKHNNKK